MSRLKQLSQRGQSLKLRGGNTRLRDRVDNWRKWYHSARWSALRLRVLADALYQCAMCGAIAESAGLVADHIIPHRGDERLFYDPDNLQCLCKPCHDGDKQRLELKNLYKSTT